MRIAIIDLGTNTFLLLIGETTAQGYKFIHQERIDVKLGEGSLQQKHLTPAAQKRALAAIEAFKKIMDEYAVDYVQAVATSAFRSANNAAALVQQIKDKTGVAIEVISGEQEAALIYQGVKAAANVEQGHALIMDIGGGSVEFIICDAQKALWQHSFEIGAQRLLDAFHCHDPILPEELLQMEAYLEVQLQPLFGATALYLPNKLIGASGTFETLVAMYRKREGLTFDTDITTHDIPLDQFDYIYELIRYKSREERLNLPWMPLNRVDMIVVACALIHFVLKKTHLTTMQYSAYSLRMGLFLNALEKISKK